MRADGRAYDALRPITIHKRVQEFADGSVLIEMGKTKVMCSASIEEKVPIFLRNSGRGWVTAEYSLLPGSTKTRTHRESSRGRVGGRTHEIQRLIGRSLRAVTDLNALGERTIWVDCDVIQADGGTRTASITGALLALAFACQRLKKRADLPKFALREQMSAVSVGIVEGEVLLDMDYEEDNRAEVDMNFVMTRSGRIIEVQGTAEEQPFSRNQLNKMMDLAWEGILQLTQIQAKAASKLFENL